jgi:hypothetical protein
MGNFLRAIAFLLFAGSLGISYALLQHGSEWGVERTSVLQDLRGVMNAVGLVLFCIFLLGGNLLDGRKRRRARNYRSDS